jgi:response regulator NasT
MQKRNSRILVVEDNDTTRLLITATLASEGYDVVEASDGMTALVSTEAESPDLAVLDLNLPGMSGVEVASLFHQRIPFLVLTMDTEVRQVQKCIDLGALGYLVKPLDIEGFLRQIRVALERGQEHINLRRALQETQSISKALGMIMVYHGLSEERAYKNLLSCAMRQKRRTADLATDIISAFDQLRALEVTVATQGKKLAAAQNFLNKFGKP